MVLYELFCIARADTPRETTVQLFERIGASIWKLNGVLRKIETSGTKPLPYRIRNQSEYMNEGQFWSLVFNMPPSKIAAFTQYLKFEKPVIRATIVKHASKLSEEARALISQ